MLSARACWEHFEGQPGEYPCLERVCPVGACNDSTRMSELHVRCRQFAAMKHAVSSAFFHLGRLTQGQKGKQLDIPNWCGRSKRYVERLARIILAQSWFRFPSTSLFEFLSSAKKYAGYSNTNEKDARPSSAHHALPEKEFSTQCARHVVQSCNRNNETHVFQRQHP